MSLNISIYQHVYQFLCDLQYCSNNKILIVYEAKSQILQNIKHVKELLLPQLKTLSNEDLGNLDRPKENRHEWFQNRCCKKSGYESREALRKFNKANKYISKSLRRLCRKSQT